MSGYEGISVRKTRVFISVRGTRVFIRVRVRGYLFVSGYEGIYSRPGTRVLVSGKRGYLFVSGVGLGCHCPISVRGTRALHIYTWSKGTRSKVNIISIIWWNSSL